VRTRARNRRLLVLNAEGPGFSVGKPGDAIRQLLNEEEGRVAMVIMIDAVSKYEGEMSGGVSEGVGATIGGIGVDQFTLEALASLMALVLSTDLSSYVHGSLIPVDGGFLST
jgi:hypothetical protein